MDLTSIELCAGAGGQALGLEQAGFAHLAAVEIDPMATATLRRNRPSWNVIGPSTFDGPPHDGRPGDVRAFSAARWKGQVDLLAGGVPCPPFSIAGLQLGAQDERDLFPEALRLVRECEPRGVMLENVRGLLQPKFDAYRRVIERELSDMGYEVRWNLLYASDYGVSQLRPRALLVALLPSYARRFVWPEPRRGAALTVGELLVDLMAERGWPGAEAWARGADRIAPTLVGGSKRHGGPDLGPSRARAQWAAMGVDGRSVADEAPAADFFGAPRLTVRMAARIQGFPDEWMFLGRKTAAYRQVGNAFPPPVARAVGRAIARAFETETVARAAA